MKGKYDKGNKTQRGEALTFKTGILILGFVLIVAPIFYYFVLFLPKQTQYTRELKRSEFELKVRNAREDCFKDARKRVNESLDSISRIGTDPDSLLIDQVFRNQMLEVRQELYDECLKKFPL